MTNNQRYVKLFLCTYLDHSYVKVKNENILVRVISNFINNCIKVLFGTQI